MSSDYQLEIDHLAIGLTKPATKFGVPLLAFYLSIVICFFGWMFYQGITGNNNIKSVFTFLFIWFFVYAVMFLMTCKDIFGLAIFWINSRDFRSIPNRHFWDHTDSYQP